MPNLYDDLTITRDDNASIVSGKVSVVGNSIYVGNGAFANSLGIVTMDNGSHFRADFSNTFYNGNFDEAEVNGISLFNKEEITILFPDSPPGDLIRLKENLQVNGIF